MPVKPAPKSLILDLLFTVGRSAAPVRALVSAASLFGIADNSLRVALARLLSEGEVERDERGLYRLGPAARALSEEVRAWKRMEERLGAWSGEWIGVHTAAVPGAAASQRRRRERALRIQGFRPFAPGLELRPDNLVGGVEDTRRRLHALGLESGAPVFRIGELSPEEDGRARSLWDADRLDAGYRATRERLSESAARLRELPRGEAMRESFLVGGEAIRQMVHDPLLPEPIVDARARRALARALQSYDRAGRRIWAGWLGTDEGAPELLPADVHGTRADGDTLRPTFGG